MSVLTENLSLSVCQLLCRARNTVVNRLVTSSAIMEQIEILLKDRDKIKGNKQVK